MSGPVADPVRIAPVVDAYRRALAADPDSIPAQIGLMRALFFRGGFCGEDDAAQKKTFGDAKRAAEDAMTRLERRAKAAGGSRDGALRAIPGAGALYFWAGVSWGQWCLDHKMAAVWQGAAGRIRDYAEASVALDPAYEQAGPYLLLGRLHSDSPKVPFVTGFVSRTKALDSLRRALALAPENTGAQFFLAQAILEHAPGSRTEAIRLLTTCAGSVPRPEYVVEDRHYIEQARARLRDLEAEGP